ncbi:unnamed protein product, partial [Ectocarpus sp. 12 AP-2014]
QARRPAVSYGADGWVRAADVRPAVRSLSGLDGEKGLYKDLSEPILELVSVVEGMGADIAFLKTANKRQAKELADVRAKNEVLELDHAKLSETYKAFSTSVVDCLQLIAESVEHGDLHTRQVDVRVERYMDSIERMTDVVGDKLHHLGTRMDTMAVSVDTTRGFQDVQQAKLYEAIADNHKASSGAIEE